MSERKTFPCLSVRAPWSWCLLHGKDIENRSWSTKFRGQIAIHSGVSREAMHNVPWIKGRRKHLDAEIPDAEDFTFGAIVGIVDLYDCVSAADERSQELMADNPWADEDVDTFYLMVRKPLILPEPIKYQGRLGIFHIAEPEIVSALEKLASTESVRNLLHDA